MHRKNILLYIQQDATLHGLFYVENALHVSGGTTTILNLLSFIVYWKQYTDTFSPKIILELKEVVVVGIFISITWWYI